MPNVFSLFSASHNSFRGQLPNENVILVKRRHWIFLALTMVMLFLFCFLPLAIYALLFKFAWFLNFIDLFWFLTALYFLFLWFLLFYNLTMYLLNIFILTNKRVIKKDQLGFFNYQESILELNKIQDVSAWQKGVFSNLLNYGDLEIQTAGSQNKFTFLRLSNPKKVKDLIYNQTI